MLSKDEQIDAWIEEIAKTGFCTIDGVDVLKASVISDMLGEDKIEVVIGLLNDGHNDQAAKLNSELFDKCARSLVIDAIASIEPDWEIDE